MTGTRVRWAAIGAAVAVALGGGGIAMVSATSPSGATTYVPIAPCRVMDTRAGGDNVGARARPLGPAEAHTVKSTGVSGNCSDVPEGAAAIAMNVTAVGATATTFLTVWDGSTPRPLASSLNPAPGQPPTPNAVTTDLDPAGRFSIYNLTGEVDVLADIVGFYTDHDHDDRYDTETEVDDALALKEDAAEVVIVDAVDFALGLEGSWSFAGEFSIAHTVSAATHCARTVIDLDAGKRIARVDLSYEADTDVQMRIRLYGISFGPSGSGPGPAMYQFVDEDLFLPNSTTNDGVVSLTVDATVTEDVQGRIALCTTDPIGVGAVRVQLVP